MTPLEDGDDDAERGRGEFAFDEPSPAEVDLSPEAPSVANPADRFSDPDDGASGPGSDASGLGDATDLDPRTHRTFVVCVFLSNAALFGVSLGAMLWYFRGRPRLGVGIVLLGLLAGIRTLQHYRSWQRYRRERDAEATTPIADADPPGDTDPAEDAAPDDA